MHGEAQAHGSSHRMRPHAITCWNAHGLKPEQLQLPAVVEVMDKSDVLIFTETWLLNDDEIPTVLVDSFHCHGIYRERRSQHGRQSGGVLVCIRKHFNNVTVFRTHIEAGILWVRFSGASDTYMGACYFPPADASHWKRCSIDPFDTLLNDVADISSLGGKVILCGDFNARTGTLPDVSSTDAHLDDVVNMAMPAMSPLFNNLPDRVNADPNANTFGQKLVQLCATTSLIICNGRLPGDLDGACTFQSTIGSSTVDYFMVQPQLVFDTNGSPVPHASIHVHQLSYVDMDSDHRPVTLSLPPGTLPLNERQHSSARKHRRRRCKRKRWAWSEDRTTAYANALLTKSGESALDSSMDVSTLITTLKNTIYSAATIAQLPQRFLVANNNKQTPHDRANAPWYNLECVRAHARIKHANTVADVRRAICSYRLTVRRAKRRYSRAREARLMDLLKHKPKMFWHIVKKSPTVACSISARTCYEYYRALRRAPSSMEDREQPVPQYTHAPKCFPHALNLDRAFSYDEVQHALDTLRTGKSADCHGDIAELFKAKDPACGSYILADHLLLIFNSIFQSGQFPSSESLGMITQIHKGKGLDTNHCTNYRGITVITVLSKIYAILLNLRLSNYRLETADKRARGQGGFLKDHRTTDHVFILQHVIDKYRAVHKPLYTCFVDLTKAFDTVNRTKLWQRLHQLGVQGRMLAAIQAYYADVRECVKTSEGLTESFPSGLGVKQGCPLSPTLFGMYIDAVEDFILVNVNNGGTVKIGGWSVPLLLYADDIVLLASSQSELQQLMDILADFCDQAELTINLSKTEVLVFSRSRVGIKADVFYRQTKVTQSTKYKYLGVNFTARYGAKMGGVDLMASARKAMFALEVRLRTENITNPATAFHMFDSLIAPIFMYGSEIWGCYGKAHDLEILQTGFIKRFLRIPPCCDNICMFTETGRLPIRIKLIEAQARYWQRLRQLHDSSRLLHAAFLEHCQLMLRYDKCWGCESQKFIGSLIENNMTSGPMLTPSHIRKLANMDMDRMLHESSTIGPSDHRDLYMHPTMYEHAEQARRRTYAQWFWSGRGSAAMDLMDGSARQALIKFRLGAHGLKVTSGAWTRNGRAERKHRTCTCCAMNIVEDEYHVIFECPAYDMARQRHSMLFDGMSITDNEGRMVVISALSTEQMMHTFMRHENQLKVAKFIRSCLLMRDKIISV